MQDPMPHAFPHASSNGYAEEPKQIGITVSPPVKLVKFVKPPRMGTLNGISYKMIQRLIIPHMIGHRTRHPQPVVFLEGPKQARNPAAVRHNRIIVEQDDVISR